MDNRTEVNVRGGNESVFVDMSSVSNVVSSDLFGRNRDGYPFETIEIPFNPMAVSLSDQVTTSQTRLVRELADAIGEVPDSIAERLFCCEFGELSRQAAERLIAFLESKREALQNEIPLRLAG